MQDTKTAEHPVYEPIGRCFDTNPGVIAFVNHHFGVTNHVNIIPKTSQIFPISSRNHSLLSNVRQLVIRITRTLEGRIAVIKSLKVFGISLSKEFLQQPVARQVVQVEHHIPKIIESVRASPTPSSSTDETDSIPSEFIDPLTCGIMSLPVILPSGYTVDQLTLDKFLENEKSWGRKPCDPFTSLPLTEANSPMINVVLKERIDKYVLIHGIAAGRTTGRKRDFYNTDCEPSPVPSKRLTTSLSQQQSTSTNKPEIIDLTTTSSGELAAKLSNVLSKTTKFRTVQLHAPTAIHNCVICQQTYTPRSQLILYQLDSCAHLVCKNCLLTLSDKFHCKQCNSLSVKSQVVRFHVP